MLRGGGFGGEVAQCLRGVSKESIADRPLAIDEPTDGPLIDSKAPRECRGATKQLDAVSEVILSILHVGDHRVSCGRGNAIATWPSTPEPFLADRVDRQEEALRSSTAIVKCTGPSPDAA